MKKLLLIGAVLFGASVAWGQYCLPTYNSQCTSGDYINNVTFNTISNLGTGCSNPSANNNVDYTAISTFLQQNNSYTITVTPGPSWGQYFVAFIDLNNDLDFADPGEFFNIGYAGPGTTISNTIAIPAALPGGPTRMRVMCRYSTGALTAADYCATGLSFGEVEDYTVIISSPAADDAGIASFVTPQLPTCDFSDSVRVEIFNYGTDPLTSATINWQLNAAAQTPVSWTGSLLPFTSETVTLGLLPLMAGDNVTAWTSMPNGTMEGPLTTFNDTSYIVGLSSGLSGTYTIGGLAPDYASFAAAAADLTTYGVCGPVVFDVRSGIYNENMALASITNASATNTITFRSETGNTADVLMSFAATSALNNYVVRLDGADYIHFENLSMENTGATFGYVVHCLNGATWNSVSDCYLRTVAANSTSTNMSVVYSNGTNDGNTTFTNNVIEGGSYGAYWRGVSPTNLTPGTSFTGNQFLNNYYYGAYLYHLDAPVFSDNRIEGVSTYTGTRYGAYFNYCDNGSVITNNSIYGDVTTGWTYGLYLLNCDGSPIAKGNVSNNMIQVGIDGGTGTMYGIYVSASGYIDYFHNSVLVSAGGATSRAFYGTGGGANQLMNNMFVNYTAGYAIYLASNYTVTNSDYNLLHSPGGIMGYYNGADQATLAAYQAASGHETNSFDADPLFYATQDLHVCNDLVKGLGTYVDIDSDIDGHPRSTSTPDMGADEFTSYATPFLGDDVELCAGDSVLFWAASPSPIDDILWSTGDTTSMIWVSAPGTYSVDIVGGCGTFTDNVVVSASADVYTDYVVADENEFCEGDSVLLYSAMTADTYDWSTGESTDSIWVFTGGTYTLDITDACGSGTASVTVTENTVPTAGFTWNNSFLTAVFTNTSTGGGPTTYSWDFGDMSSSTDMEPTHVYGTPGMYYVELTVTNDCGTHVFGDSVLASTVGLEEIAGFGTIAVYPNPSNGLYQVDFDLNNILNLDIRVTNILGEEVFVKHVGSVNGIHTDAIDITKDAPGVYFISILSDEKEIMTNMLIKK